MTREEIDTLWSQALSLSLKDGSQFTRYHFATLVAEKEREACAKVCDSIDSAASSNPPYLSAMRIRARNP